jgi:alpha-glucosidase
MGSEFVAGVVATLVGVASCFGAGRSPREQTVAVHSPEGRVVVTLRVPAAADASPQFSVRFRAREILRDSSLDLFLLAETPTAGRKADAAETVDVLAGARLTKVNRKDHDETYRVIWGKQNPVRDHYRQATLTFKSPQGIVSQMWLRVFDDSVAIRYAIPAQPGLSRVRIADERTSFRLVGEPRFTLLYRDSYTTSHEGLYASGKFAEIQRDKLIDLPALFEFRDGTAAAITEANLQHYGGMYLRATNDGALVSDLAPRPSDKRIRVKSAVPMVSPWRVILVGDSAGRLIESTTILSLNETSRLADTSWIQPGKTTWPWWNGTEGEPAGFETKLDLRTMKHYVDFCARHGIAYHSVVSTAESDLRPWYQQTQRGFAPGPDTEVTKPRPEIELEELARYAAAKGVGLRLWAHWQALEGKLEEVFAQYERWGIRGLMVDFLDRDDQEMVEFSELVLQKAAEHRLHIQFHGVWKPTGRQRTWPNLFNHEGVLNLEYLKWSDNPSPAHNLIVPFTRLLAGPLDYHLGGFRAVRRDAFHPRGIAPVVLGTRCHHLAMYVVYENPMPMVVDYPTAYENQPGFDFIARVPTTWDETRVLHAKVGESIVVARRHGREWYLGAMTDWTPRSVEIPLQFLAPGTYLAEIWSDTPETVEDPNHLAKDRRSLSARDRVRAEMASGGGWVMHLEPATPE